MAIMATNVLLTVDTELIWRGSLSRTDWEPLFAASYDPAGVGVPYQLRVLAEHNLKACFFVDPTPAYCFGIDPIKRMVAPILEAGQDIQLHLHPQWASLVDGIPKRSFELCDYSEDEQWELIQRGIDLLVEAGAPRPIAFRSGSYAANDATMRAAARAGLRYESSHNGAYHPWPSGISLPVTQIAPVRHEGLIELPVSVIRTPTGLRTLQICAVSLGEMRAALIHAALQGHALVNLVSHSFELSARNGMRPNRVHLGRFKGLCRWLAGNRDRLPTRHCADLDLLACEGTAEPLPHNALRTLSRQAGQLWSNLVEERG